MQKSQKDNKKKKQVQETKTIPLSAQLFNAIKAGDLKRISEIHQQDKSLLTSARDEQGNTSLMVVCALEDHATAHIMIKNMLTPKTQDPTKVEAFNQKKQAFISQKNNDGKTALMILLEGQNSEEVQAMAKILIEGADQQTLNEAAHFVANNERAEFLTLFLSTGALLSQDENGHTPMELIVKTIPMTNIPEHQSVEEDIPPALISLNPLIVAGEKLEGEARLEFILQNETNSFELSVLLSSWCNNEIEESEVPTIIAKAKKLPVDEQYMLSYIMGFKPQMTFSHIASAAESFIKEKKLAIETAAYLQKHRDEFIAEVSSLKEKAWAEKLAFIKKHATDSKVLAETFQNWYGSTKQPQEISEILQHATAEANRKMTWNSWALGYSAEINEGDLQQILGYVPLTNSEVDNSAQ